MRYAARILVLALLGLVLSCETPSVAKQVLTPYVRAYYEMGTDGEASTFRLYLAEGKVGPSISDATVTLDGAPVTVGGNGYYYRNTVADPVGGESHNLKITHPSFAPLAVSVIVPADDAPAFVVTPAPMTFPAKRDTSSPGTFDLTPTTGTWPASGVRVLFKGYTATNQRTYSITTLANGTSAGTGTFPIGKAERTGFEVRNIGSASIVGAANNSFFQIDGEKVTKAGFDPLTDIKPLVLEIRIENYAWNPVTQWNASQRSKDGTYLPGATFQLDGVGLNESSTKGAFSGYSAVAWAEGSSHSYTITDKDGVVTTGTITMPTGKLTGVTYAPAKGVLANSYTVTPPPGGWPSGSYIECIGIVNGSNWSTSMSPTGSEPVVFNSDFIGKASSVNFYTGLQNVSLLESYSNGSQVSVLSLLRAW